MATTRPCLWLVTAALFAGGGAAWARSDRAVPIDSAERAIRELRYEDAQQLLDGALQRGHLSREELIAVYALRGQVAAVADDASAGESEFRRLLVLDPEQAAPRATPVISGPFAQARRWVAAHGRLRVDLRPPSDPRPGVAARLTLAIMSDPFAMVQGARILYRARDDASFTAGASISLHPTLPPLAAGAAVDYYVEVLDAAENVLLRVGTPDEPLRLELAAPPAAVSSAPKRPTVAPVAVVAAAPPPPLVTRPRHGRGLWAAGGTVGAIGVGLLVAGIGVDVTGRKSYDVLLSSCAPSCSAADVDRLHQKESAAIALYTTAGVSLATAAVLLTVEIVRHARER
jgi:hypothetical protein